MKPRRRGRAHGAAMMVWLFFANLFDPAKAAVTEQAADPVRAGEDGRRSATAAGKPE